MRNGTPSAYDQFMALATRLKSAGDTRGAAAAYKQAVWLAPNRLDAHYELGYLQRQRGHTDEALACFEKVTELEPTDPVGFNNLGVLYFGRDESAKAIQSFRRALRVAPEYPEPLLNLVRLLLRVGRSDCALSILARRCAIEPGSHRFDELWGGVTSAFRQANRGTVGNLPAGVDRGESQGTEDMKPGDLPRVLYVDLINSAQGADDVNGQLKAYAKVSVVRTFDYRWLAQKRGTQWMNQTLVKTALEFRPDIIHIGKGESIAGGAIKAIKERLDVCVLHFNGDFRWQLQPWMVDIGRYADYTVVNYTEMKVLEAYRSVGVKGIQGIVDAGADPDVMCPMNVQKTRDVVFLGSNNYVYVRYEGAKTRKELIEEAIRRGIDIHVYGTDWEYLLEEGAPNFHIHSFTTGGGFAEACSRAKITLGVSVVNNVQMYASWQRPIKCMACGAFHLTHYVPGLETVFENGKHLVWFHSVAEAMDLIEYYLDHEEEREAIARAGRAEVLARHTWDLRIADTLEKWWRKRAEWASSI